MDFNLSFQRSIVSVNRIFEILEEEGEDYERGKEIEKVKGEITFKNVYASFEGRGDILKDVSFKIGSGEKVGITGESGVGKSTIAMLLLRFYKPKKGKIYIDGKDISEIKLSSLRKNISYVSQDLFLFSDTIKENIRFGCRNASEEDIKKAAILSGVDDFVKKLPEGYNTKIGERGVKLSGGERQRIAIARAILKDAPIVIFDEATSNLDERTEKKINNLLKNIFKNKTLIVITHRMSTISSMDRIIYIHKGKVET